MKQHLPSSSTIIAFFLLALFMGSDWVFGFTEPSNPPPDPNVSAPLNVDRFSQIKTGGLILNAGTETGAAPNGLLIPFGNVGIGTITPSQMLDVAGYVKGRTGLCMGDICKESWPAEGVGGGSPGGFSASQNGWTTLSNDFILQWGKNIGGQTVSFPTPFPNAVYSITGSWAQTQGSIVVQFSGVTTSSFYGETRCTNNAFCPQPYYWMAIGR